MLDSPSQFRCARDVARSASTSDIDPEVMDFFDNASAVDDSYGSLGCGNPSPFRAIKLAQDNRNDGKQRPRSGRRSVNESVNASGVDDRCYTNYNGPIHVQSRHLVRAPGDIQPIAGALLRKLAKATQDDIQRHSGQKTTEGINAAKDVQPAAERNERRARGTDDRPASQLKEIQIPRNNNQNIRVKHKDRRSETVKQPILLVPRTRKKIQKSDHGVIEKTGTEKIKNASPRATSVAPGPTSSVSLVTAKLRQTPRRDVRIVGKNGDEAMVELPWIDLTPESVSRAASQLNSRTGEYRAQLANNQRNSGSASQIARAFEVALQLRWEKENEARLQKLNHERSRPDSESFMMSGALPTSPEVRTSARTTPVRSMVSSSRTSTTACGSRQNLSSERIATASDTTTICPPSVVTDSRRFSQYATGPPLHPASSHHREPPACQTWYEAGFAGVKPPQHQLPEGPTHCFAECAASSSSSMSPVKGSSRAQGSKAGLTVSSEHSVQRDTSHTSRHASERSIKHSHSHNSTGSSPRHKFSTTVFAGQGWISPHPLSCVTSELDGPPQSEIQLPSPHGATLTYHEWCDLQKGSETQSRKQSGHRNHSRTSSSVGRYRPGGWGYEYASQRSTTSPRNTRQYQSPAVETVQETVDESVHRSQLSSASGSRRYFHGAAMRGNTIHLRMPWDE